MSKKIKWKGLKKVLIYEFPEESEDQMSKFEGEGQGMKGKGLREKVNGEKSGLNINFR